MLLQLRYQNPTIPSTFLRLLCHMKKFTLFRFWYFHATYHFQRGCHVLAIHFCTNQGPIFAWKLHRLATSKVPHVQFWMEKYTVLQPPRYPMSSFGWKSTPSCNLLGTGSFNMALTYLQLHTLTRSRYQFLVKNYTVLQHPMYTDHFLHCRSVRARSIFFTLHSIILVEHFPPLQPLRYWYYFWHCRDMPATYFSTGTSFRVKTALYCDRQGTPWPKIQWKSTLVCNLSGIHTTFNIAATYMQ